MYGVLSFCSLLLYCGGITWFVLLSHVQFSERCYFSENALLPGLVASEFTSSQEEIQNLNLDIVSSNSGIVEELQDMLTNAGLEVYKQEFAFQDIFIDSKATLLKNGTNVYGIVRAPRSGSTESLVVNVPFHRYKHNFAIGAALTLAKQMRKKIYWAKDIVFLFSEHGVFGARAWLNSYHGVSSPWVFAGQLPARAGSIQSAFSLEMEEDAVSYVNIKVEGYNGQLPNLDLFNVAVRLANMEGMSAAVHHKIRLMQQQSADALPERFDATLRMMKQQASGTSNGNHGEFLRHGIEAVTLQTVYLPHWGNAGYVRLTRIVEGITRSLNNLLERFHQSFFFYLLPSTDNYISIGMYMPALGSVLAATALKALSIFLGPVMKEESKGEQEEAAADKDKKADQTEEMTEDFFSDVSDMKDTHLPVLKQLGTAIVLNQIAGLGLFSSPAFTNTWSQMFDLTDSVSVTLLLVVVQLAGMVLAQSWRLTTEVVRSLYALALIELAIVCGTTAIINFSLGMLVAAYFVPISLLLQPTANYRNRILKRVLLLALLPATVLAVISLWTSTAPDVDHVTSRFIRYHVDAYEQYESKQSWLFAFVTALVYPISLHFTTVAWSTAA